MKFTQSRWQGIYSRLKQALLSCLAFLLVYFTLSYFIGIPESNYIGIYIASMLAVPIVFTFWLLVFNSGTARVDEYSLEFTEKEIRYWHMCDLEIIEWSEFEGFCIKGFFSKEIVIYGKVKNIRFLKDLFNREQQKSIIKYLSSRGENKV